MPFHPRPKQANAEVAQTSGDHRAGHGFSETDHRMITGFVIRRRDPERGWRTLESTERRDLDVNRRGIAGVLQRLRHRLT